jgi:small subunit ribosomal protein S2
MKKIKRNLDGIRGMTKLPGALVIIDVKRETNAIMEAKKLGIPTVCLIDTDGDPEMADIPIPGNDDSMRSIDVVIRELCAAVTLGKTQRAQTSGKEGEEGSSGQQPQRRSSRSQFRAADEAPAADGAKSEEPAAAAESN